MRIYTAQHLGLLLDKLCEEAFSQNLDVFQPHTFVTQTDGMNDWLSVKIAQKQGVCANVSFMKPNHFVGELFKTVGLIEEESFVMEQIKWLLFDLLKNDEFVTLFPVISEYYEEDDKKRMQLATIIGDLFDQYLVYRPDFISAWNNKEQSELLNETFQQHEDWQKWLWIALNERLQVKDRVQLRDDFFEKLSQKDTIDRIQKKFKSVSFFGISILTQYHLDVIYEVSKYMDVCFYLVNPSPNIYWYDDRSEKALAFYEHINKQKPEEAYLTEGNQLLQHWGRLSKDVFLMLFEQDVALDSLMQGEFESDTHTLLSKIQSDIHNNALKTDRIEITSEDVSDGSIIVANHYTPSREIEALYDYISDILIRQPNISSKDIVVMVNDVERYKPYIQAVFDSKIPYSILDQSYKEGDTICAMLDVIVSLTEEYFTAEKMLSLLDFSLLRTRFEIDDVELIREVLQEANIRCGISGEKEEETAYVSWEYGLNKLVLGYAMGEEYISEEGELVYPYRNQEGQKSYELLKFKALVDVIIQFIKQKRQTNKIEGWCELMLNLITQIVPEKEEVLEERRLVEHRIAQMKQISEEVEAVSFGVFQTAFLASLFSETQKRSFVTGGITFCSMIPMRSIPFKVTAILGMNRGEFPRKDTEVSFDLVQDRKRRGDRSIKESDTALFLDTFLATEQQLYISYIGKNSKTNEELAPSSIVDELLNYIQSGTNENVREKLVRSYPLNDWGEVSFDYVSYRKPEVNTISLFKKSDVLNEENNIDKLDFNTIIRFFKDIPTWYFANKLNIRYEDEELLIDETELLSLSNALSKYQLQVEMLEADDLQFFRGYHVKQGSLPLKNMADITLEELEEPLVVMKQLLIQVKEGANLLPQQKLSVEVEGVLLDFTFDSLYDNQTQLLYTVSKTHENSLPQFWLKHLFLSAVGYSYQTNCVLKNVDKVISFDSIDKNKALEILVDLIQVFKNGQDELFLFSFKQGFKYLKAREKKSPEESFNKIISADLYEPCWQKIKEEDNFTEETVQELEKIANLVFQPVLLKKIKEIKK